VGFTNLLRTVKASFLKVAAFRVSGTPALETRHMFCRLSSQVGFDVLEQSDSFMPRESFADAPAYLRMRLTVHSVIDRGDQQHGPYVGVLILPETSLQLSHYIGCNVPDDRSVYRHRSPP
jgi:hypothetical protein